MRSGTGWRTVIGGDGHQAAPLVFLHPGQDRAGKVDHAHEVQFHRAMPLLGGGGEEHLGRRPAGVGHANVDAAELLRDVLHKLVDGGSIRYIQWLGQYRTP